VVVPGSPVDPLADQVLAAGGTPRRGLPAPTVELTGPTGAWVRVQCGQVDGRAVVAVAGDEDGGVGSASVLTTGELTVRVSPGAQFGVCVLPPHRVTPEGTSAQWRREVLEHATTGTGGYAAEIASYALNEGHRVRIDRLGRSLGLLRLWHRVPECPTEVRSALVGLEYWIDQPGPYVMCRFTWWRVRQHQQHGETLALEWLTRKLFDGYGEFHSAPVSWLTTWTVAGRRALASSVHCGRCPGT
jgi:hypothetical protein